MGKKKEKKGKVANILPEGCNASYSLAKKATGINFRSSLKNYKKQLLVRNKIYMYFYKNLQITTINIKEEQKKNIAYLKKINCYRGVRHKLSLPVRGQRTKTNAKTEKKKRKKGKLGSLPKKIKKNDRQTKIHQRS